MRRAGSWREPRRLAFHILTIVAVAVCVMGARWQWDRAHRTQADAVPDVPAIALTGLDPSQSYSGMHVTASGRFDAGSEVLVAPRSRDGQPGAWVLTPLVPADGPAVAVVRGWVPEGVNAPEPPQGEVVVDGVLVADTRSTGVTPTGDPPVLIAVDTGALAGLAGYPVRSGWIAQQGTPGPGQPLALLVTELPGAEVGLNLRNAAYAVQWIVFAGFALFFWNRFRREYIVRTAEQELHP